MISAMDIQSLEWSGLKRPNIAEAVIESITLCGVDDKVAVRVALFRLAAIGSKLRLRHPRPEFVSSSSGSNVVDSHRLPLHPRCAI